MSLMTSVEYHLLIGYYDYELNDQNHFIVWCERLDFFTYIHVNLKKLNHLYFDGRRFLNAI